VNSCIMNLKFSAKNVCQITAGDTNLSKYDAVVAVTRKWTRLSPVFYVIYMKYYIR
jgi:hypothetical protein